MKTGSAEPTETRDAGEDKQPNKVSDQRQSNLVTAENHQPNCPGSNHDDTQNHSISTKNLQSGQFGEVLKVKCRALLTFSPKNLSKRLNIQ